MTSPGSEDGGQIDPLAKDVVNEVLEDAGSHSIDGEHCVVLRCESRAEEWHFDELLHRDEVRAQERLNASLKSRQQTARLRKAQIEGSMEEHANEMLSASTGEDVARAALLSQLREDYVNTVHNIEVANEETLRQITVLRQTIEAERNRGDHLKKELVLEREAQRKAKQRMQKLEEWKAQELRSRRERLVEIRAEGHRALQAVQDEAAMQVRQVEAEMHEELQRLQEASVQVSASTSQTVGSEFIRRRDALGVAERDIVAVDSSISKTLASAREEVQDLHSAAEARVKNLQAMDFEHEHVLRSQVDALCSQKKEPNRSANLIINSDRQKGREVLAALGDRFARSQDFKLFEHKHLIDAAMNEVMSKESEPN